MENTKKRVVTISILVVIVLIILGLILQGTQKLNTKKDQLEQLTTELDILKELSIIDSIILNGDYNESLKEYKILYENSDDEYKNEIQSRIDVVQLLIGLKNKPKNDHTEELQATINSMKVQKSYGSEQIDSLNFALMNANLKIENLQRQLNNKSYGDYLTFKNAKGNTVHYVGEVKDNKANGQGIGIFSTGSTYEGDWKDNMKHGYGSFHWPDGEYYKGLYKNDLRNGMGSYYWPNGDQFTGEWENDLRNGIGEFYGKKGKLKASGTWINDELQDTNKNLQGKQ